MATGYTISRNLYFDSVFLMQVAKRLSEEQGIEQVAALMGTEKNKRLLVGMGFEDAEILAAGPNDLIIALKGKSPSSLNAILDNADAWLLRKPSNLSKPGSRTLAEALVRQPHANLVVISVPGDYAASEARMALERGLNVFLFSDNVPVEDELSLKQYARERGLIVMGPDCGTAIIAGVGVGFSNIVRRGPIGVIGAMGTGLQEFTTLVHKGGSGISHAIGTGSRDLSDAIGGISTLSALEALEADPHTEVIALLSKPPGAKTLLLFVERLNRCSKPIVVCFLGIGKYPSEMDIRLARARTLDEAAALATQMATGRPVGRTGVGSQELQALVARERAGMTPEQKYIRGIFAGGTFCYQAQQVMRDAGLVVHSNSPLDGVLGLADPLRSVAHTLVDMGAEMFTQGRPHPMIDATLCRERILAEAEDPQVAVLLVDFILGYNASPDPVGDLLETIAKAKLAASQRGGFLSVAASVCGTEDDPQDLRKEIRTLGEAGVVVLPSSAQAALFSRTLVLSLQAGGNP
ncbi:MAG: acyl-CoA synthetase FdrA [Anaerolineae bacterium]|nr:acyl-CoA synthetase FdrA [Anaerolineae bacterium]